MKFLIDDADIERIKALYNYYPIDGVTTNPSILAKYGKPPYEALLAIREFIGNKAELHAQVISTTAEDMVLEGRKIERILGNNTYIKIPTIPEGLKAMQVLRGEGYHVTATGIYTPMQAYLAAKAGAEYAAPYVNRIDNLGADGVATTKKIQDIYSHNKLNTRILAAGFKNSQQVQELCEYGVSCLTISSDVIENLIKNANVTAAVNDFVSDFESLCGKGKTMLNCEE
ncbi:MAG: fructose-6-phosphate aldolase [Oscillospiraceae bacterium]|nr:fructose-6-phosphate aldolase [Oscillospiraceae bacterium]